MLGAERPEPAGRAGRRGDGRLRAGGVDLLEPARDEVLADRLAGRPRRGARWTSSSGAVGDPLEDRVGIVVAGLDALEVQDREPAEAGQLAGQPGIDDRVHRRGEDRDREVDAAERLGEVDVGRLDGVGAGRERDVLEAVGRADRVDLRVEDAPLGRVAGSGMCVVAVRSITWPSCAASRWAACCRESTSDARPPDGRVTASTPGRRRRASARTRRPAPGPTRSSRIRSIAVR